MVFNKDVLFIHLGKTGGMSITKYLCNVLKPPVTHVVKAEEFENAKQAGYEVFHPWKRHANLVEIVGFLKSFGIQLADFKVIICVVRNPFDLDFSYYKHLNTAKNYKRLLGNPGNQKLLAATQGKYENFGRQKFTHHKGQLKNFFEIDGKTPGNMKIVRFEELSKAIPELVNPFAIHQIPFPHVNKSDAIILPQYELSNQALKSIYKKYGWIFENYYPSLIPSGTIDLPSNTLETPSGTINLPLDEKDKKYLFIAGCGRSGTPALTTIIGSHARIVLGMERYNRLMRPDNFKLSKAHFAKERFINVQDGDTGYDDFYRHQLHLDIPEKWDNSEFYGLKYPPADRVYNKLKEAFGSFHYLYIYRNIFDVAESWNRNAASGTKWPAKQDYIQAVKRWNTSLNSTLNLIKRGEPIICIKYEDLFFSDKSIEPVFEKLGLPIDENVLKALATARKLSGSKKLKKGALSKEEHDYVAANARFNLYEEFNTKYNVLV